MSKAIVCLCFLVALAAGLTVGYKLPHTEDPTAPAPVKRKGWLAETLKLTPEQQEQMNQIWSRTASHGRGDRDDRRRAIYRERDEAIIALIRPEDQDRYQAILNRYEEQKAAMDREMREAFDQAVEQTKAILNAQQREQYEALLKDRSDGPSSRDRDRGPRGKDRRGRGSERGRQGDDRATSQPVTSHPE